LAPQADGTSGDNRDASREVKELFSALRPCGFLQVWFCSSSKIPEVPDLQRIGGITALAERRRARREAGDESDSAREKRRRPGVTACSPGGVRN
jgi:hypothetical protein